MVLKVKKKQNHNSFEIYKVLPDESKCCVERIPNGTKKHKILASRRFQIKLSYVYRPQCTDDKVHISNIAQSVRPLCGNSGTTSCASKHCAQNGKIINVTSKA